MTRRSLALVLTAAFAGCLAGTSGLDPNDAGGVTDTGSTGGTDGGSIGTGPFCEVVSRVFEPRCNVCHKAGGNVPDLTWSTVQTSIVNQPSPGYAGTTLVVPGNPGASLLYRKLAGTQAANEGGIMPVGGRVSAEELQLVEAWINAGAPTTCTTPPPTDGGSGKYHPDGYANSTVHGPELKLGTQDCRSCHGADLTGGSGPTCDTCHGGTDWRTSCTFCHGGSDNMTGSPPRDIRDRTNRDEMSFRPHTEHGSEQNHAAWDCTQCHIKPSDVLSVGHVFDDSKGKAEVDFSAGLSADGQWDGTQTCSNLYCHGNGRMNGRYDHDAARPTCTTCHGGMATRASWRLLSGQHNRHLGEDVTCGECHSTTVNAAGTAISEVANHVNGNKDVAFLAPNFTRANGTCTGVCHGERHTRRVWQ